MPSKVGRELQQALAALRPRLRRFAYGLTGSLEEADEVVQSAYVRALARLDQWQPGTRLDSWMYRIVQTVQYNRYRSANTRRAHGDSVDPDSLIGSDDSLGEARATLGKVRQFIWSLSEEHRAVLLLVTVEGLSYKETADTLGIPIGTVTSRLARARLALADMLAGRTPAEAMIQTAHQVGGNHEPYR